MTEEPVKPLPFFFVGRTEAQKRVELFQTIKHKLLSEVIGKTDTKAVWYSRGHIEGLLDEMNHANADGLRVYFGSYDESHMELGRQTCLLMVMTREDPETGEHADFDLEDEPDFAERSSSEKEYDFTERYFNVGSPCPPICSLQRMKYGI